MTTRKKIPVFLLIVLILLLVAVLVVGSYWVLRLGFDMDVLDRSGWKSTDAGMQYWDYHGDPLTGWQTIDGSRFYFHEDGTLATGWRTIEGGRYYFGSSGVLCTGWQTIDGSRYYLGEDGAVRTDTFFIDDQQYWADRNGALLTHWQHTPAGHIYLGDNGILHTGWQDIEGKRYYLSPETGVTACGITAIEETLYYFDSQGALCTGWQEINGCYYYFHEDGSMALGWTDLGEHRFYFTEAQGSALGWQEIDGKTYYFKDNGVMAIGQITVDGVNHFFTSQGVYVLLVNPWNPVPEDYDYDFVTYGKFEIHRSAYDALRAMVKDGRDAGNFCAINNTYRSKEIQQYVWNRRKNAYIRQGYDAYTADILTGQSIAIPGRSEHQTGLAVDFALQDTASNAWLMEHCWDYGFILRYPADKIEITGIIYEPWHYRYVGLELAQELKELGLCLEEYMQMLTEQENAKTPPEIP